MYLKNNSGYGLIDLLVTTTIGSFVLIGVAKLGQKAIQKQKIAQTDLARQDLGDAMRTILAGGVTGNCKENLSQDFSQPEVKLKDYKDMATDDDDDELIIQGKDFNNALGIKKIALENSKQAETDPNDYSFVIYYTKKLLGNQATPEGYTCDKDNPENCYYIKCEMDYKTDPPDSSIVTQCKPGKCEDHTGKGISHLYHAGQACGHNELLMGFKANGEKICIQKHTLRAQLDTNPCAYGQALRGYKNNGSPICERPPDLINREECPAGQYLASTGHCKEKPACEHVCSGFDHRRSEIGVYGWDGYGDNMYRGFYPKVNCTEKRKLPGDQNPQGGEILQNILPVVVPPCWIYNPLSPVFEANLWTRKSKRIAIGDTGFLENPNSFKQGSDSHILRCRWLDTNDNNQYYNACESLKCNRMTYNRASGLFTCNEIKTLSNVKFKVTNNNIDANTCTLNNSGQERIKELSDNACGFSP